MPRNAFFSSPFLIGFDRLEEALDRLGHGAGDAYPPYNIEDLGGGRLTIVLAVAGFDESDLDVAVEGDRLVVQGRKGEAEPPRQLLHRGIAQRGFQRTFLLADGIEVVGARLADGLLTVDLARPAAIESTRRVPITGGATESTNPPAKARVSRRV